MFRESDFSGANAKTNDELLVVSAWEGLEQVELASVCLGQHCRSVAEHKA